MNVASSLLPVSFTTNARKVSIGGCSLVRLATEHGTPLYVYDEATVRFTCRAVRRALAPLSARISFAAKACSTLGVLRILRDEQVDLDVVSGGEMEAGRLAGFSASHMHLHGNYKSDAELVEAVVRGLRAIVVDSLDEFDRLEAICARLHRPVAVMLRITLPDEASTHPHIRTSGRDSKFGFQHHSRDEERAVDRLRMSSYLNFIGLHTHAGSQISDAGIYSRAADELISFALELRRTGLTATEVSVGGGWAVPYLPGETGLSAKAVAKSIRQPFAPHADIRPAVEPGRSLIARAGVALYRAGSVKQLDGRRVVAVDGGMGDNPRPALYGANYHAFLAHNYPAPPISPADIVGRDCEAGDVIARSVDLPDVLAGDLVCIPMSGAYHLSMESSYNRVPQAAVVMVRDGVSRMLVRRGTTADLFRRELESDNG